MSLTPIKSLRKNSCSDALWADRSPPKNVSGCLFNPARSAHKHHSPLWLDAQMFLRNAPGAYLLLPSTESRDHAMGLFQHPARTYTLS
jgi:hypothetical protein